MTAVVGVDVGGTFTDVVFFDGRTIRSWKTATTDPQAAGVVRAIRHFIHDPGYRFLHGTTVATNALLEETGARVLLVTTPGFEDLVEIGRQARPSLYDLSVDRPPPLADREMRLGHETIDGTTARILDLDPEAVAVGLLGSYRDPREEATLARAIRDAFPGLPVSVASEVSPAFREYERLATTLIDAYLAPGVSSYLEDLNDQVSSDSSSVMTSSGGLRPFSGATRGVGQLTLSGPAAGVVAGDCIRKAMGRKSVITFDMGGTSTDVARVGSDGLAIAATQTIGGRVNRVPSMPIHTVGAGGGSLAWRDSGGALRVGPQSAGADPGPAAYGRGGSEPTVTDANVFLGLIPDLSSVSDSLRLSRDLADEALARLGRRLGLSTGEIARGILRVVDAHMDRAIRRVSVEEGFDPRESSLVAFGGAGGLHATRLARGLEMLSVIVPPHTGAFSALGLLMATPRAESLRTVLQPVDSSVVAQAQREVVAEAEQRFVEENGVSPPRTEVTVDARYAFQSHELTVAYREGEMRSTFDREHQTRFGFMMDGADVEVVNVRAVATGPAPLTWDNVLAPTPSGHAPTETTLTLENHEETGTIWRRDSLAPGDTVRGPGVVVDGTSSVLLAVGDRALVLDDGTLEITW